MTFIVDNDYTPALLALRCEAFAPAANPTLTPCTMAGRARWTSETAELNGLRVGWNALNGMLRK